MGDPGTLIGRLAAWRRFRVVVYLVLGLIAIEGAVAVGRDRWRAYDPDEYREKPRRCRRQERDFVFVGGSPVCEGLDPSALVGLNWHGQPLERGYNLGLSGATTSEIWHAVAHGLSAPPRLMVYGITASDLNDSRDEPHGPRVLMTASDVATWIRLRPQAASWCAKHFVRGRLHRAWSLYHFRNGLRLWTADQMESLIPGICTEAAEEGREGLRYAASLRNPDGFSPRPNFREGSLTHMKRLNRLPERFPFLEKYQLGGHLIYLHRLLDWAETNQVDLVLLDMPVSADLEELRFPEAFAAYRAALEQVERERGAPVLRATRSAVGLTDDDFADLIHLNQHGATRLSHWMRDRLSEEMTP